MDQEGTSYDHGQFQVDSKSGFCLQVGNLEKLINFEAARRQRVAGAINHVIGDISIARGKPLIHPSSPDLLSISSYHSPLHHSIHRFCVLNRATVAHIDIGDCQKSSKNTGRPILKSHATPLQPSVATDAQQGIATEKPKHHPAHLFASHSSVEKLSFLRFLGQLLVTK